jgi:hypothetical protein
VRYELGFYIPEYAILHGYRRENLKSYTALTGWVRQRRRNVSPMRYELGFYIPEDGILHGHRSENLKSYRETQILDSKGTRTSTTLLSSIRFTEWVITGPRTLRKIMACSTQSSDYITAVMLDLFWVTEDSNCTPDEGRRSWSCWPRKEWQQFIIRGQSHNASLRQETRCISSRRLLVSRLTFHLWNFYVLHATRTSLVPSSCTGQTL